MIVRRRVRFSGRVQGVGFRATSREIARRHGVVGWVRNEEDQSVLLEAQGELAQIAAFLGDLRVRMARNIVSEDIADVVDLGPESEFVIRR